MKKGKLVLYIVLIILLAGAFALVVCSKFFAAPQEAYAAEVNAENNTGIDSITMWGLASNVEPTQELYFEWVQTSETTSIQGRANIQTVDLFEAKDYTVKIAYIGNPARYLNNSISNSVTFQIQGQDSIITINNNQNGISEYTGTYSVISSSQNIFIDWFYNLNKQAPNGTYWINILLLQIYDTSNNYLVNYQSYLYDYLKTQFDNANSSGYENGINDGESIYRNNPFNGASLISVITEEGNHEIKQVGLNILSNGVSFSSINQAADKYFTDNGIDSQRYTVTFKTLPFVFEENQILISRSMGFYSLYFTDTNNNSYQIQETSESNSAGWCFLSAINSNAYGKQIEKIQITFANTDYVGTLYVGQTAAQDSAYNEGYDRGYKNGLAESVGSLTGWDAVRNGLTSIFGALNIKIFGLFSLGDLMGIVLIFSVVMFFLKIIRG